MIHLLTFKTFVLFLGSRGAFCEVRPDDKRILEFYSKLGCFEIAKMEGFPKDVVILGRSL
jgi:protein O-GlcNAcase/histone acetyltransferase